jgi:hypothetical protein
MIYDIFDDPSKGIVYYTPYLTLPYTSAPVSPPKEFSVLPDSGGNFLLSWLANIETDLAGYKIYYDTDPGYPYINSIDVGNVTTFNLTAIPPEIDFYITITAYDINADGVNDQVEGYESWFAKEKTTFPSSINEEGNEIPKLFILYQNYPNPFNPSTIISYSLHKPGFVTLSIYNITGKEFRTLVNQFQKANSYSVNFDGSKLSSGVFFCKLKVGNENSEIKKNDFNEIVTYNHSLHLTAKSRGFVLHLWLSDKSLYNYWRTFYIISSEH